MFSRIAYSYGCIMVPVPLFLADSIKDYASTIPDSLLVKTEDALTGIPDETHITVKYGVLTEDVREVAEAVYGTLPIVVRLGRAGVFHNPDAAVIRLSVDSQDLQRFHNKVCKKLKTVSTYRNFHPHVTVAYMVQRQDDPYYYRTFFRDDFEGREFVADRVVFSAAGGRRYSILFSGGVTPLN